MFHLTEGAEPIPGYKLLSRLGAGGYGEVWKVTAPGDLTKAMKFVYGRMDDVRAARELKALSRIKQVRHPFLLSLERFEILDGQLIVVTELADMSLLERYEQCRKSGQSGIPREELLTHLRDAADALDFMSETHGLQHLDIKPENMLLVGGRVKVADFGLVKDLTDGGATQIGGVTPVYAAPEAFDGRASRSSDQYSLAVTYQEMLTGVRPFPGTTAAQLAIQHTNSPPVLSPLPLGDRASILRALAKDPLKRFGSCRELLDSLQRVDRARPSAPDPGASAPGLRRDEETFETTALATQSTQPAGESLRPRSSEVRPASRPPAPAKPEESLPPISLAEVGFGPRPTIVVGVGGTGAAVARRFRQRLADRFGSLEAVPAFQLLAIETDPRELQRHAGGPGALEPSEMLYIPLRKPQEYRKHCDQLLGWLSRRWLYNIPRSQLTEGLRPLGRLALVDHSIQIFERLTQAIALAMREESLAATAKATGSEFRSVIPRIWIVASIAGGTGGGMLLDLGYLARQILGELHLPETGVAGMLTHGTSRNAQGKDLARSNAYATLTELAHFDSPDIGYPGDSACGLLEREPEIRPFEDHYLIHLGDDLGDSGFQAACDSVAEYLYLDAVTHCGGYFDHCRAQRPASDEPTGAHPTLRTFGMHRVHFPKQSAVNVAADLICKRLVERWRGESSYASMEAPATGHGREPAQRPKSDLLDAAELEQIATPFAEQAGLSSNVDKLAKRMLVAAESKLGNSPETIFAQLLTKLAAQNPTQALAERATQAFDLIDTMLGLSDEPDSLTTSSRLLSTALDQVVKQSAADLEHSIGQWLLQLVENPKSRLNGAIRGAEWFCQRCVMLRQTSNTAVEQIRQGCAALAHAAVTPPEAPHAKGWLGRRAPAVAQPDIESLVIKYGRLRLQQIAFVRTVDVLESTHGQLVWLAEQFGQGRRRLAEFEKKWHPTIDSLQRLAADSSDSATVTTLWFGKSASLAEAVKAIVAGLGPEFMLQFDTDLQRDLLAPQGGLHSAALTSIDPVSTLLSDLRAAARAAVLKAMQGMDAAKLLIDTSHGTKQAADSLPSLMDTAKPQLRGVGGLKRFLLLLPEGPAGTTLHDRLPPELASSVNTLFDPDGDIILCQESEQLPLALVADLLIGQRSDYAEIAHRTMTRVDVYWSPLHAPEAAVQQATLVRG